MINSRKMRWAEHVACMGERRGVSRIWVGLPEEKRPFGRQSVDGIIILKWILRRWNLGPLTGSRWLRIGTCGGHL